jgi:hypothetical protein
VGDEVLGQVMLIGSHEVGVGHELRAYFERLICRNGMTQQIKSSQRIFGHSTAGVKALTEALSGLNNLAIQYQDNAQKLVNTPLNYQEAMVFLIKEFGDYEKSIDEQPRVVKTVLKLFDGQGLGSDLMTSYHTAWGLLNCLTEYYSHSQYTNPSDRLKSFLNGCYGSNINRFQSSLIDYSQSTTVNVSLS